MTNIDALPDVATDIGVANDLIAICQHASFRLHETNGAFSKSIQRIVGSHAVGLPRPPRGREWAITQKLSVQFLNLAKQDPRQMEDALKIYMNLVRADGSICISSTLLEPRHGEETLESVRRLFASLRRRQFNGLEFRLHRYRGDSVDPRQEELVRRLGFPATSKLGEIRSPNHKPSYGKQITIRFCRADSRALSCLTINDLFRASEAFRYLMVSAYASDLYRSLPLFLLNAKRKESLSRARRKFPISPKEKLPVQALLPSSLWIQKKEPTQIPREREREMA